MVKAKSDKKESGVKKSRKKTAPKAKKKTAKKSSSKEAKRPLWVKLLAAGLVCFAVLAVGIAVFVWHCYLTLPDFSKALYVERAPGIKILASDGREITSYGGLFAEPVNVDDLPSYVAQAVVDTEDRRFYSHHGFDYIGFVRAMGVNVIKRRYAQGASTLTQQVAKNLFLTREKSVKRKVQELLLARWLEDNFSKKQILNIYLNRVFFGSGAYGINTAAKRFFNKEAAKLNLREAAILAGALKAPSRYNYLRHKQKALDRADVVLKLMNRAGTISDDEMAKARKMPVGVGGEMPILGGRYFGDYVMSALDDVIDSPGQDIYVKTTLDYNLQQRAEYLLRKNLRENKHKNVSQGAVVILDNEGAVKAMAGGFDYEKSQFNRASQALRQAGSGFKFFVFAAAFEKGFKVDELLADEPLKIDDWEPKNYDRQFHGAVTLKQAFAQSLNVATVDLATYLTLEDIINTAHKLGISSEIKPEPAIILGAAEVKVLDMAAAYTVAANGGYAVFPFVIKEVTTSGDEILYQHQKGEKIRVLSKSSVEKINELLREVVMNGTGKKAKAVKNAKGKTGTSQNYRDAWFIGSNARYTAAVWVGNDDNSPMKEIGGGTLPTKIWAEIMK